MEFYYKTLPARWLWDPGSSTILLPEQHLCPLQETNPKLLDLADPGASQDIPAQRGAEFLAGTGSTSKVSLVREVSPCPSAGRAAKPISSFQKELGSSCMGDLCSQTYSDPFRGDTKPSGFSLGLSLLWHSGIHRGFCKRDHVQGEGRKT